jgi:hypothetical protein
MGPVAELVRPLDHAMEFLPTTLLVTLFGASIVGCRHLEPLVTADTDRTGWVEVARVQP